VVGAGRVSVGNSGLTIGFVPDPVNWEHWEKAKALLEPARERGNFASVLDPDEVLCAVMDGNELLAVATAWLSTERYVEVKLVGGRDHHRWLGQLDNVIGAGARMVGATRIIGIGRAGWLKSLRALGWVKVGETDPKTFVYAREI